MNYLIKLEIQGPEGEPDERGYTRRPTLTSLEHAVPHDVAAEVVSSVLRVLSERLSSGEPFIPPSTQLL